MDLVCKKEKTKINNILKQCKKRLTLMMMQNKKIKENNKNWPQIPDHPYRILIIGGSGSRKANSLLNLISHQPHISKIYLYVKKSKVQA